MDGLTIATFPEHREAISGASLAFQTALKNTSASPVRIPGDESPSQFTYALRPWRDRGRAYTASAAIRDIRGALGVPPPTKIQYDTLAPGESVGRTEDLADLVGEGIEPNNYFVTAHLSEPDITSPRSVVTIVAPNVESWSSAMTGPILSSVLAHRAQDGGITLYQRESLRDPREGVFYPHQTLPAGGPVTVATAIDVAPAGAGRWFAWLRDRTLTASAAWGTATTLASEPVRLNASQPALLSPGFQVALGTALFGVIDRRGNAVQLLTFLADRTGLKLAWSVNLTPNGAERVAWNCQGDRSITVVWQEPVSGRILSLGFDSDGRPVEAVPRVRTSSRPAAWSVEPAGPLAICMLGRFDGSYRYARLGANASADPRPIAELVGATGWGLSGDAEGAIVVATTASAIWETRPGGEWRSVAKTENPQRLHVFVAAGGTPWVEWIEPAYGIRRVRLA